MAHALPFAPISGFNKDHLRRMQATVSLLIPTNWNPFSNALASHLRIGTTTRGIQLVGP